MSNLSFFGGFSFVPPSPPCRLSSPGRSLLEPCQPLPSVLLLLRLWVLLRAAEEEEVAGPILAPVTRCVSVSPRSPCQTVHVLFGNRAFNAFL